jgi:(2R)-ethylmalonyl-CoA mutase
VYTTTEPSPLAGGEDGGILVVDEGVEASAIEAVRAWRSQRGQEAVDRALAALAEAARDESVNIMPASIEAARAGVTTGEWAQTLREVFGEYRAPTGVADASAAAGDEALAVVYEGIRLTPSQIAKSAVDEGVHVVGLSILSGSHMELIPDVIRELEEAGADVPVIVGGIIPSRDAKRLQDAGVARVFTPKDFQVTQMMSEIVDLVAERHGAAAAA